jgi:hypothetical protein
MDDVGEDLRTQRHCLPGCNRLDGHDGREASACMGEGGVVLTPGPLDLVHRHPDIPVAVPVRREVGIIAYDLEPPSQPPPPAEFTPLRHPARISPRPRYDPPPLAAGYARVKLDDDFYSGHGWSDWTGRDTDHPAEVFDIPAEQRERWMAAQAAYSAMQEEISALMDARAREPGYPKVPLGWKRKGAPYQVQP